MGTVITTHKTATRNVAKTNPASLSAYSRWIESLKFSHFGIISMTILIGSIMGGIASMVVFQSNAPFWQFVVGLYCAMANLVASIAQAPIKWVVNLFFLSVGVSTLLILINSF